MIIVIPSFQRFIKLCLLLLATAVFLAACGDNNPSSPPTANSIVTEVAIATITPEPTPTTIIVTPEPTPTTAVCTPLPDEMTIDIQFESNLHGVIVVTGLQPSDRLIILLTGDAPTANWRYEFELAEPVGDNGRFQDKFDFRSWPSIEDYTFQGKLIHQRGVACFEIVLPQGGVQGGRTVNGRLVAAEDETQPLPGVLLRLEPEGEPVAQTNVNGRFTIQNVPLTALRLYAQRLDFSIPAGAEVALDLGDIAYPPLQSLLLSPTDYPPSSTPYWIEEGDFWLIHTPDVQFFAFVPLSPTYAEAIDVDECRYIWDESVSRFIDPCSGDEWDLNGALNLAHSTELWSNRDLDQYDVSIMEEMIGVQFSWLIPSVPVNEPPLAIAAQYGVTVTAVTADFSPTATTIDTVTLVDPLWQMNPTAFPPQQALTYMTMPDWLIDDQGRSTAPTNREGEPAVFDAKTGGLRQLMHNQWQPLAADARTITVTLTIELLNLTRQLELPLAWDSQQVGDVWNVNVPLEIGYAEAQVTQIEWLETLPVSDGLARLRLTVTDASLDDIRLYCLHLATSALEQQTCPNFEGEQTYTLDVPTGEPLDLHLLAALELKRPFTLVMDVGQ